MLSFAENDRSSLTVSAVVHVALFAALSVTLIRTPMPDSTPVNLAIKATVMDQIPISRAQEAERERQLQEQLEQQREKRAADERQKKEKAEQQKKAEVERKKKAEADQKRKAETERKKKAEAEQQRKAEAERKAALEKERAAATQKAREAEMRAAMEAEEQLMAAQASGMLQQYAAMIQQRIERNWVRPASAKPGIDCELVVTQIPGGEVTNVRVGRCNGDAAVVRSIEAAVYKASPLPEPPDQALFDRTLKLYFKPEQ
ncbi:MAG: cell envelope integrity protein TolA [Gammaproteobacteria bacterium]